MSIITDGGVDVHDVKKRARRLFAKKIPSSRGILECQETKANENASTVIMVSTNSHAQIEFLLSYLQVLSLWYLRIPFRGM